MIMASEIQILVVDDDPYLLDLLLETLKTIGFNAVGAPDAMQALSLLESSTYHLVITDINMPEIDGIEFARRIKEKNPSLPVIFITGIFNPEEIRKAVDGPLLAKPFRIGQIETLIQETLSKTADTPSPAIPKTILVVDDDDSFRVMLMETLKLSGYQVIGAIDGNEALAILEKEEIGTVITDIKMPGMDGLTLARFIKRRRPNLPVILVTAYLPANDQASLYAEADGYLMKPFKIESITELLENLKEPKKPQVM
jgi:CheY-like chemotaxis protein